MYSRDFSLPINKEKAALPHAGAFSPYLHAFFSGLCMSQDEPCITGSLSPRADSPQKGCRTFLSLPGGWPGNCTAEIKKYVMEI